MFSNLKQVINSPVCYTNPNVQITVSGKGINNAKLKLLGIN